MTNTRKQRRAAAPPERGERGSALLIISMVTAVLALMGISFLVLSETESKIAQNRRDSEQVLSIAESGLNLVVTWYNNPDPVMNKLLPRATDVQQDLRVGDSDYNGTNDIDAPTNGVKDYYRGGRASGAYRLFDRPYRGLRTNTLWGSEDAPDILIQDDEGTPDEYIDQLNALFNPTSDPSLGRVRITEIRIFAPPFDTNLKQRFGVATISVTAVKERRGGGGIVARRTIRAVLNEIPFPVPIGSLEAEMNIDESGNFGAHWGGTSTEANLDTSAGSNFPGPSTPRASIFPQGYADFSPDAPDLDLLTPGTQNLLTQLMDPGYGGIPDPWLLYKANGEYADAPGNPAEQPWPWDYFAGMANDKSFMFAHQTYEFPSADYEIWKAISQMNLPNVHYYKYAGLGGSAQPTYRENGKGAAREAQHWVNLENPATGTDPAIYFFDTANSENPQNGGAGVLTAFTDFSSGDVQSPNGMFYMAGFIYMNASILNTSGISNKGRDVWANQPAEPFLDEGIDLDGDGIIGNNQDELDTIGNGIWDFDLDGDTVSDGDMYAELYGTAEFQAFAAGHQFGTGVLPHGGADPSQLPTRPHEPFLNFAWNDVNQIDWDVKIDFDFEATNTRYTGYDMNNDGVEDVTTTLWDMRGSKLSLIRCNLEGILYNEGAYSGAGNMNVYGSVFFRGGFTATGTPNIYYNSEIYRGNYPYSTWNLPRVFVSAMSTDR